MFRGRCRCAAQSSLLPAQALAGLRDRLDPGPACTTLLRGRGAKQHLAARVAHLDAASVVEVLNQECGEEQLALRLGTLARRIIIGELDAIIVADAVGPDSPGK